MKRPLSNNKKRKIQQLLTQINHALEQGSFDTCEQLCRQIDSLQPDNADAANMRGLAASRQGQADAALAWFRKAIEIAPRRCEFHANLAGLYLMHHQYDQALSSYRQALKLRASLLPARLGLATTLSALLRYDEAIDVLQTLQRQRPRDQDILMRLFRACYQAGRITDAESWLRRLLTLNAQHVDAHYSLGMLLLENGQQAAGLEAIRTTLRLDPGHADAALLLSSAKRFSEEDEDVRIIMDMYDHAEAETESRSKLGFACGKVLDDLGQIDKAFECIHEANAIRHQQAHYDADTELAHLEAVMASYTPDVVRHTSGLEDRTPIFIVGMPRCGSTLVEQILAAHPDVSPRGETGFFEETLLRAGQSMGQVLTLEHMAAMPDEALHELGVSYLGLLRDQEHQIRHLTDKTLSNIRLIGAIHKALPEARIIHVRRHPLDTCWSIYRHHLLGAMFDYGHNLGELGYYYRMYLRLMQHWRDVLPANVMYELDYEQLVADPEGETRKLLEACELEQNERCLRFYESSHAVRTASFMQVRQAVNDASVGAWQRYEHNLQPLLRILKDYL